MNEDTLEFSIFCIESLAEKLNKSGKEVYKLLTTNTNILYDYIVPCYNILHTQSKQYITEELVQLLSERGVLVI